jgi:hypothetical protein
MNKEVRHRTDVVGLDQNARGRGQGGGVDPSAPGGLVGTIRAEPHELGQRGAAPGRRGPGPLVEPGPGLFAQVHMVVVDRCGLRKS